MNFIDEFLLGKLIIQEVTPEDATAVRLCDKHHPLLITFLKVKLREAKTGVMTLVYSMNNV